MDIQEQEGFPLASFEVRPSSNDVVVAVYSSKKRLSEMYATNNEPDDDMDTTKEIIAALENAKQENKA